MYSPPLPLPSSDSPVTNDAGEGYSGQVFDKAPSNSPIPQSDDFKPELAFFLFVHLHFFKRYLIRIS